MGGREKVEPAEFARRIGGFKTPGWEFGMYSRLRGCEIDEELIRLAESGDRRVDWLCVTEGIARLEEGGGGASVGGGPR